MYLYHRGDGHSLGVVPLYPILDIRAGYDTNVFASRQDSKRPAYEAITFAASPVDGNNHMLNFGALARSAFGNARLRTIRTSVSTRTAGLTSRGLNSA
jgi:hypothetical protein